MISGFARASVLMVMALLGVAQAQAPFPSRPIRILIPIPPGGATENRTGANGNIAAAEVAKSPADATTLLLGADSGITINPHVYGKLTFDTLKDLVPVSSVATNQFTLSVNPQLPVNTFAEFIDHAR